MADTNLKDKIRITNLKMVIITIAFTIGGVILLYLSEKSSLLKNHPGMQRILGQLAGLLLITATLTLIWDLIGKRSLANEIMSRVHLSGDLEHLNVLGITLSPDSIQWLDFLKKTKNLDVFLIHGTTWRGQWGGQIRRIVKTPGSTVRIILPDTKQSGLIHAISESTGEDPNFITRRIQEAFKYFQSIAQEAGDGGGRIEIWMTECFPAFSLCRFDSTAVICLYSYSGKSTLPHIVCGRPGLLYEFIVQQFETLVQESSHHSRRVFSHPDFNNS
jgi:hypothetical protein